MDQRLEHVLEQLKAFAFTRPVAIGAPACAVIGVIAGLAMQPQLRDGPYETEMDAASPTVEAAAEPIAWPTTGKVPDYVVGTDFVKATQPPAIQYAAYEPPAAGPDVPAYEPGEHGPATAPPDVDTYATGQSWAPQRVADVPAPQQPVPMVLAEAR